MAVGIVTTRTVTGQGFDSNTVDSVTITATASTLIVGVYPFDVDPNLSLVDIKLPSNGATAVIRMRGTGPETSGDTNAYFASFTVVEVAQA